LAVREALWCVSNIACHAIRFLYIYSHSSSILRCPCLTAVRRECLPTRHTSMRITSGSIRIPAQVVLCCPARSWRCCRSYSKPRSLEPLLHAWRRPQPPRESLTSALEHWRQAMNNMSQYDRMHQIALYLLSMGGADATIDRWRGTPGWMAPEIGKDPHGPKYLYSPKQAYLWSCGLVLRYLAREGVGKEENRLEVLTRHLLNKDPRLRPLLYVQSSAQPHSRTFFE
jgi:hypothetical protein